MKDEKSGVFCLIVIYSLVFWLIDLLPMRNLREEQR